MLDAIVRERIADRVGIIHQGELMTVGSLSEITAEAGHGALEEVFLALTDESDE